MKFLLIDTNNYLHRFFYGNKEKAVEIFLGFLKKGIKHFDVDGYCCCLDAERSYRYDFHEDYKKGREKNEEFDKVYDNLIFNFKKLGIFHINSKTLEAEDICNLFIKNHPEHEFVVLSGDKDCLMLYNWDNCLGVFNYEEQNFTERNFQKYGIYEEDKKIAAQKMLMYLTLRGDTSDNIPGIVGIGEKKIQNVLKYYDSLEQLKKRIEQPTFLDKSCKEFDLMLKNKESLALSEKLVRLFDGEWKVDMSKYVIRK